MVRSDSSSDSEKLLWELSRLAEGAAEDSLPDDRLLYAYRRGELGEPESERLEQLLAASPEARQRLLELAGAAATSPLVSLRRRVLNGAASDEVPPRPAGQRSWRMAAGWILGLIAIGWCFSVVNQDDLPVGEGAQATLPRYEVTVAALAEVRSGTEESEAGPDAAYPDTQVRIVVEPEDSARADVEFGLYRREEERLHRIPEAEMESGRGAASLSAPAVVLVGSDPGTYRIWVVVAERGDLPQSLRLDDGAAPEQALAAGRRFVAARDLVMLSPGARSSRLPMEQEP